MPNRILKESITTSNTLPRVSLEAECLFYRLIVRVDDFGRYHGEPGLIYAHCFGNRIGQVTVEQVNTWLGELVDAGLAHRYEVGDRPYVELITFGEHNPRRATASKFPAPSTDQRECEHSRTDASSCEQAHATAGNREQMSPYSYSYSKSNSNTQTVPARACEDDNPVDNSDHEDGPVDNSEPGSSKKRLSRADMLAQGYAEAGSNWPEEYAAFLSAYPKRRETQKAWQAWCAEIAAGSDPNELVSAARHYAEMTRIRGTPPRYIKMPASFLDSGAWRDYVSGIPPDELDIEHPAPAQEEPTPRKRIEIDPAELEAARARFRQAEQEAMKRGATASAAAQDSASAAAVDGA